MPPEDAFDADEHDAYDPPASAQPHMYEAPTRQSGTFYNNGPPAFSDAPPSGYATTDQRQNPFADAQAAPYVDPCRSRLHSRNVSLMSTADDRIRAEMLQQETGASPTQQYERR